MRSVSVTGSARPMPWTIGAWGVVAFAASSGLGLRARMAMRVDIGRMYEIYGATCRSSFSFSIAYNLLSHSIPNVVPAARRPGVPCQPMADNLTAAVALRRGTGGL